MTGRSMPCISLTSEFELPINVAVHYYIYLPAMMGFAAAILSIKRPLVTQYH